MRSMSNDLVSPSVVSDNYAFEMFWSTLLRYNLHTIKHTHFSYTVWWVLKNVYHHVTTTAVKMGIFLLL